MPVTATATLEEDLAYAREERKALPDMSIRSTRWLRRMTWSPCIGLESGRTRRPGWGFRLRERKSRVTGMTLFRFQDGKIREEWGVWDKLSAMRQAGLLPSQH